MYSFLLQDHTITEKLSFQIQIEKPGEDSIYSEETLGGYIVIAKNENENETKFPLETLFNAIIINLEKINSVFEKEVDCEN